MIQDRLRDCYQEINELKGTENKNGYEHKVKKAIKICVYLTKENQRSILNFQSPQRLFKHEKTFNSTRCNVATSPALLIKLSLQGDMIWL